MATLAAKPEIIAISSIGGTDSASIAYDDGGEPIEIWQRLVGGPWKQVNLIAGALARNPALTADQASEAEHRGEFDSPPMAAGQVIQYGILPTGYGLDPNAPGFSLGRFSPLITIVAILSGVNEIGWIIDQNISVGGTFYARQVATGPRLTTMRMEVGEMRPTSDPLTGVWTIPNPGQVLYSTSSINHVLEALGLLAGHTHFATLMLVDGTGHWSSLWEDFTTLRRLVTVQIAGLEIVNDSDPGSTGEAQFRFHIVQGSNPDINSMHIIKDFVFDHGNISDKVSERNIDLLPLGFTHVVGPEVVQLGSRYLGVWSDGTEFDGFLESDEPAWGDIAYFTLPTGLGRESVTNAAMIVNAQPSADGSDFAYKVKVAYSVEYV